VPTIFPPPSFYEVSCLGEEFLILSSETKLDEAHALAERIRRAIERYKFKRVGNNN
jgi:GGDEF domain-containing protein